MEVLKIMSFANDFISNKIYKSPMIIASIIGFLNVIFAHNYLLSNILVFSELTILLYYFFKKDIVRYFGNYLIFLTLSFEFNILGEKLPIYGFKSFRFLGINMGILSLLPILLILISKRKIKINKIKNVSNKFYKFLLLIVLMNFIGLVMGLFQILINDNNIQNFSGVLNIFLSEIYDGFGIIFLVLVTFVYLVSYEFEKINLLEDYLTSILIGISVSIFTSLIFDIFGRYGGVKTLLGSNVKIYIPFLILFKFYNFKYNKVMFSLIGIISTLLLLFYNASGKLIILSILVGFGSFYILFINKKLKIGLLIALFISLSLFPLLITFDNVPNDYFFQSVIFQSKFGQVKSLFNIWKSDWISAMPPSPRVRIIEITNIFYEYLKKPWFLVFGKGYLGTFKDHISMLKTFIPDSYSMKEWKYGSFYGMHETLNSIFLYHGIFGIYIFIYLLKLVFLNLHKNPWILIGGFWFFMFYGFSVILSVYGVTSLIFGFIKLDN